MTKKLPPQIDASRFFNMPREEAESYAKSILKPVRNAQNLIDRAMAFYDDRKSKNRLWYFYRDEKIPKYLTIEKYLGSLMEFMANELGMPEKPKSWEREKVEALERLQISAATAGLTREKFIRITPEEAEASVLYEIERQSMNRRGVKAKTKAVVAEAAKLLYWDLKENPLYRGTNHYANKLSCGERTLQSYLPGLFIRNLE